MKYAFFILMIQLAGAVTSGYAQSSRTLSDSVAAIRPADLLAKDIRWNRTTTDFYTYWVDSGLYGFYGPQPKILIDGLPIDADFFGWQNLKMLPIENTQKIDYSSAPQMYNSSLSPAGFIDFQTGKIDTGISVNASFYAGNETGDPGPYNYDSLKVSPNVDRWGPDETISVSYLKRHWYAKAGLVSRKNFPTDLALNSRLHFTASQLGTNQHYVNHIIYSYTQSGLIETGYRTTNVQFRVRTASGLAKDYLFLQPFGREIPTKTAYRQVAIEGKFKTGRWKFDGRYIGHQKTIDRRFDLHPYIFDWNQRKRTLGLSATYASHAVHVQPGVTYQRLFTKAPGLGNTPHDLTNFSLNTAIYSNPDDSVKIQMNADYDEEHIAKTYGISFFQRIANGWKIEPVITHAEVLPLRQNSFSYWVNRGYTFADSLGIPYTASAIVDKNRLTLFKLDNTITITPHLILSLEQRLINHQALNIPFQQVKAAEFTTDTQPGAFSITQEKGTRLRFFTQLRYAFNTVFKQSLALNIQRTLSGSERYKNYFKQVPDTKIQYKVEIYPTSSLGLFVNALYQSSTTWNEFNAIEGNKYHLPNGIPIGDVTGTFHTQTPAFTDISVGLKKGFWNQRLHAQFLVRNILNEEIRLHPLGAKLATKFDIKISLNI